MTLHNECSASPGDRPRAAAILGRPSPLCVCQEIARQTALKAGRTPDYFGSIDRFISGTQQAGAESGSALQPDPQSLVA
ncbi:hypothetical protein R1flu_019250 [Riccia fluitans]|uniref:Uncharacterized protein n=1 Tax=Riccia fluitans TaxID=41844 RepID=A0ABD1ZI45_9MARC